MNDFILLQKRNVSGIENDDIRRHCSLRRRTGNVSFEYQNTSQCTLETAAASQCFSVNNGLSLLKDVLLLQFRTGVRASVFSDDSSQLLSILKLHGICYVPNTIRECKIMILQHLLNGDCMRHEHLCHKEKNTATSRPDRTACRALSAGFCDPQNFIEGLLNIVTEATTQEINTDNLLLMVESTGQPQLDHPHQNLRRQLLRRLKMHCAHTGHRVLMNTPAFDIFHDLLVGFEQCNFATLASIMARHRITVPSHVKMKRENMRSAILTHISEGHCIINGRNMMNSESSESINITGDTPGGCEDVCTVIDPQSNISDEEMKITLLETLNNELPRLPMLHLFKIQNIEHCVKDSLKTLRKRLQKYIDSLKERCESSKNANFRRNTEENSKWPQKIPESLKDKIASLFMEDTSSNNLRTFTCVSCGEARLLSQKVTVNSREMCLSPLHRPDHRYGFNKTDTIVDEVWLNPLCESPNLHENVLDPKALLDPRGIEILDSEDSDKSNINLLFCSDCHSCLLKSKTPPLALANHMFLGEVPSELQDLTMIEEAMIAKCRAKSWVVQLQTINDSSCLPNSQRGLKGHTIVYPQQPQGLIRILPPSVTDICTPVCVIFVGSQKPSNQWLKTKAKPLVVRREKVRKALEWLRCHNPLYSDVEIDYPTLETFPENDVLPYHIEHLQPSDSEEQEILTSRYDQADVEHAQIEQHEPAFENVVVTDIDGNATSNQLRAAAMRHVKEKKGGYIEVPHDSKPVNEFFNPELFPMIYPTLYPYGIGGFEDSHREVPVSLKRHVKHLFNLSDRRFQEHYSFMFTVFNILQRRAILLHSSLKVKAQNFDSVAAILNEISADTIRIVCDRVAHGDVKSFQNDDERKILQLLKEVNVVVSHVAGSSASRVVMRNEIRAMIIDKGLPSFYITINPADVFNPVVKFLAGSEIDVDRLLPEQVPSYLDQSILVAKNPFVASKFFNLYMKSFIKNILGHNSEDDESEGILGNVNAYYGCVEAQGRGTLHCHMLVWVKDALNCEEIREKVQNGDLDFQRRLIDFLDDTISNEIPLAPSTHSNVPSSTHNPCSVRGLNSECFPDLQSARQEDLHNLVKNCQTHKHTATCFKYWKGPPDVKECRFDLGEHRYQPCTYFDEKTGEIHLRCLNGLVNNFNETIIRTIRCNMDIKFIGSGPSTKAVIYYITDYITKSQLKTHVAFAALEIAVRKLNDIDTDDDSVTVKAKRLLQKCAYAMISHQELSAQQICSYLMEFEDHFTSHEYRNIFWKSFEAYVDRILPLKPMEQVDINDDNTQYDSDSSDAIDSEEKPDLENEIDIEDEVGVASNLRGEVIPKNGQVLDYMRRGKDLEQISLWDYVARVQKKTRNRVSNRKESRFSQEDDDKVKLTLTTALNSTAISRAKYSFSEEHPDHESHVQQICRPEKKLIPVPIGPPMPRRDREKDMSRYHRIMLILFKPWSTPNDLIQGINVVNMEAALKTAFENMVQDLPQTRKYLNNMQALHDCKDNRDDHFQARQSNRRNRVSKQQGDRDDICDDFMLGDPDEIGNEILEHLNDTESSRSNANNNSLSDAEACVRAAEDGGMFNADHTNVMNVDIDCQRHIEIKDRILEDVWANEYEQRKNNWRDNLINFHSTVKNNPNATSNLNVISKFSIQTANQMEDVTMAESSVSDQTSRIHIAPPLDQHVHNVVDNRQSILQRFTLNAEQTRAFSMIADHSCSNNPEQLRMFLGGPGGTGKSQVINALRTFFQEKDENRRFRLASFTGVAAHNIKGTTLHAALGLNQQRKGKSGKVTQELIAMWRGVNYLFIDEVSMIGCKFLFKIHQALCISKENKNPFGGINIIFAGDFAQLPPVGDTRFCSKLNTQKRATNAGQNEMFGKLLWLSVNKCVMLTEIMRQRGPENQHFIELLQRLRIGQCNEDDYDLLNTKILCHAQPDWAEKDWTETPVIVSNNEAKDLINIRCAEAFAAKTGRVLHYYHALDYQAGKIIEHPELRDRLKSLHTGKTEQRAGLLPLVVGMPVMICSNFDVPNGVVNGCTGTLKEVRYTSDREGNRYAHSCVVLLPDSGEHTLSNLSLGEVPILEDTCAMTFTNPHSHKRCSIKRTQLPIVPAFAITAHKSQGKSLPTAIVDIQSCRGTEPVYVMLSRVTSIERLRILRPFKIQKIQCRPSEDSRREAQRVSILEMRSAGANETVLHRFTGGSIEDKIVCAAPEKLEDPEELKNIQTVVSSLNLPLADSLAPFQKNKRAVAPDSERRLLKKRRINIW